VRDDLRRIAHAGLTFNAPLSEERAGTLVQTLAIVPGRHVLDLGCGWGELLLRIVAAHPAATGTGVDTDRASLDRGRRLSSQRGLHERVDFVEAECAGFDDQGDVVVCVGASQAWGGAEDALASLRGRVSRGGLLLFGDGFWESIPDAVAAAAIGELPSLDGLLLSAQAAGFRVEQADRSSQEEWDAFESAWRSGLERSHDPAALALAAERKAGYESGYRSVLGFAWLVLAPA
jgi:cyclopropane fatty-acyl-phospholipid synthase-like methyltransferase